MSQAKDDHKERVDRATEIKNQINKTFAAVLDANAVLQVLADDGTKCQLNQEVEDLREAIMVMGALDDKLVWLDEFNKNIIDYDKICTELEGIVKKDRADLDALIKPPTPLLPSFELRTDLSHGVRDPLHDQLREPMLRFLHNGVLNGDGERLQHNDKAGMQHRVPRAVQQHTRGEMREQIRERLPDRLRGPLRDHV